MMLITDDSIPLCSAAKKTLSKEGRLVNPADESGIVKGCSLYLYSGWHHHPTSAPKEA